MRIEAALALATDRLSSARQARELLMACLTVDLSVLWSHPERELTSDQQQQFLAWLGRCEQGYPLAYLVGKQAFWTMTLNVNEHTLIPRPETEQLVEAALATIPPKASVDVLDLGTGSGAIALAIAVERPLARVLATDISPQALQVAAKNAQELKLGNVSFQLSQASVTSAWFDGVEGVFSVIVSNPPYVELGFEGLDALRFEPQQALVAGEQGLDDLQQIIALAPDYLISGGVLLLEHGAQQGGAVQSLLKAAGFDAVSTINDLAGLPRVTQALIV